MTCTHPGYSSSLVLNKIEKLLGCGKIPYLVQGCLQRTYEENEIKLFFVAFIWTAKAHGAGKSVCPCSLIRTTEVFPLQHLPPRL